MKAALFILFACIAGSMANPLGNSFEQLVQQGQAAIQAILGQLQQQAIGVAQQVLGNLSTLISTLGGRFNFEAPLASLISLFQTQIGSVLQALTGGLAGLIGGRAGINIASIFGDFLSSIEGALTGIGQHLLNQGLSSVLGALGGLGGARAIGDIFAGLSQQLSGLVTAAQGAIQGVVSNLAALGSNLVDASIPHLQQLQEQLVGHGLNVLGSISETINNLHGTLTGGR
jgi:hypothetical protein